MKTEIPTSGNGTANGAKGREGGRSQSAATGSDYLSIAAAARRLGMEPERFVEQIVNKRFVEVLQIPGERARIPVRAFEAFIKRFTVGAL